MGEKLDLKKDGIIWLHDKVENILQDLYNHYRSVYNRCEYLSEEIKKVKSETYKDEELAKMKQEYDRMYADYNRGFAISKEESEKINAWMKEITKDEDFQTKVGGAIGGRFKYEFIPTSIGVIGTITDSFSGKKLTFQEP